MREPVPGTSGHETLRDIWPPVAVEQSSPLRRMVELRTPVHLWRGVSEYVEGIPRTGRKRGT